MANWRNLEYSMYKLSEYSMYKLSALKTFSMSNQEWQMPFSTSKKVSKIALKLIDDCSFKNFIGSHKPGLFTNSMMLSQTAVDVHVFCEAFLRFRVVREGIVNRGTVKTVMARIVERGNYHHVPIFLDYLRRSLDSNDGDCARAILLRGERAVEGLYKKETCDGALPSQHSQHAFIVAVAAVLRFLAFVFQYLIGYIDRGGTKTYSSGCFSFRASFVCVLLFLAAFVWIKFRQAARPPEQPEHRIDDANHRSHVLLRKYSGKYEARFTIPVTMRDEAHPVKHPRLTLGEYKLPEVAAFVWRVAETCYEGQLGTCCVTLQGEPYTFPVPAMSEQERGLVGEEKKKWVMKYAKDVGKKEYAKYAKQLTLATGTGSNDRSPSRRTRQPSLMLAYTAHQPLNGLGAPSCSVPHQPPGVEELNAGSQHFQLEHQEPAQGFEGPGFSAEVEPQWPDGESPPSDGRQKESTDEEFEAMISAFLPDSPPVLESTHDRNMPYSDSAPLEDDSSPVVEAEAATVEHPQLWSVQTFQQGWDAGDAVLQYAGRTGSDPGIVVEESELVLFQQQNPQVIQGSESQLVEPSQQMSGRSGEPSESTPQLCERLLKDNERLRKENERWRDKYEGLRNEIVALARKFM